MYVWFYFAETADNVGNKEGNPAEQEDPHDDPDCDGGLVLLHQTLAHLGTGDDPPHPLGWQSPVSPRHILAVLNRLNFGQQFAAMKPELHVTSELIRGLREMYWC